MDLRIAMQESSIDTISIEDLVRAIDFDWYRKHIRPNYRSNNWKPLRDSIETDGLQVPIIISQRDDGTLKVLQGVLRSIAISNMYPEDKHIHFPGGLVPCRYIEGLTEDEELFLAQDHDIPDVSRSTNMYLIGDETSGDEHRGEYNCGQCDGYMCVSIGGDPWTYCPACGRRVVEWVTK